MSNENKVYPREVVLQGEEYKIDLQDALDINEGDLSGEFRRHAGLFAFYSTAHELALREEKRIKAELDRLGAVVDYNARREATMAGKKLTETMVKNTVITNPDFVEKQNELFDAEQKTGLMKTAKDAMIHRRDMLVQMGANQRAESSSDLSLKGNSVKNIINK